LPVPIEKETPACADVNPSSVANIRAMMNFFIAFILLSPASFKQGPCQDITILNTIIYGQTLTFSLYPLVDIFGLEFAG
jgi:hypothetical protein